MINDPHRPATLRPADHAAVAVSVPSGDHVVGWAYRSAPATAGASVSAVAVLGLVAVAATTLWRRRRDPERSGLRYPGRSGAHRPRGHRTDRDHEHIGDIAGAEAAPPVGGRRRLWPTVPFRDDRGQVDVTVVLPCYNEQDHVLDEVERITKALDNSDLSCELLVIDDQSTDDTLAVLQESLPRFPHVRLMPFRRNGGSGRVHEGWRLGGRRIAALDAEIDRLTRLRGQLAARTGRTPGTKPGWPGSDDLVPPLAERADPSQRDAMRELAPDRSLWWRTSDPRRFDLRSVA